MEAAVDGREVDLPAEAAKAPRGAAAKALPTCDLVMKGGITSGVVYPGAVIALAQSFRFAALGGTSAGAIAAGVCAAAEYGRLRDTPDAGLPQLGRVSDDLAQEGFLTGLFQATPGSRALMDLALLPAQHPEDGSLRRAARLAVAACAAVPIVLLPTAVLVLGLIALAWGAWRGLPDLVAALLILVVGVPLLALVVGLAVAAAVGLLLWRVKRALEQSHFGLCPGTRQDGYPADQMALTEWLDERIQAAAGRPRGRWDQVLTIADLRESEIALETMTTDLSRGRPLRCPAELKDYGFRPSELRAVFPAHVLARMIQPDPTQPEPTEEDLRSQQLRDFDPERLPVLVAIRLSLSFPILLSAVPLYLRDGDEPKRSLFSDGGIASNFPVHFFDAWFPRWPTFGINLDAWPGPPAPTVLMHGRHAHREIAGWGAFGGQIKDTMQNWRDNLQAEMAGYRDRIADVYFKPGEGGLSLQMKLPQIKRLMERGHQAGELLAKALPMNPAPQPATKEWAEHRLTRFQILMSLEQQGLQSVGERSVDFLADLGAGRITPDERDPWAAAASEQTLSLLACVKGWGPDGPVDFELPAPPQPVMRVVPRA